MGSFLDSEIARRITGVIITIGIALSVIVPVLLIDLLTSILQ